jgi:CspA family cold shock protein
MLKGKVKWYNEVRGFGFIASENKDDIFVHRTGLTDGISKLESNQEVVFETRQGEKGLIAINVKPAK